MTRATMSLAILALGAIGVVGCSKRQLVDVAMSGAPHASSAHDLRVGGRFVLAGDMHCHVLPPDAPHHVSRDLRSTIDLAKKEGLDFVVLTPHVPMRFFMDEEQRSWMVQTQRELRASIAELRPDLIVIPGFEYTDHRYGHASLSFADPAEVLVGLTPPDARAQPERFFERWVALGGLVTINHPVSRPLKDAPFGQLRSDMSWRAFGDQGTPPEIAWITARAQAIETFNATVSHLRDQFIVGEEDRSLREAAHLVDRTSRDQHRRIAAVGGSDSHGQWLRATTFVLASDRSVAAIREAIMAARTCVRGPEACSLQVRPPNGREDAWRGVGDAITTAATTLEARASGGEATYLVNGAVVATAKSEQIAALPIPKDRCAIVRVIVGRSWSSGMYVNCHFPD